MRRTCAVAITLLNAGAFVAPAGAQEFYLGQIIYMAAFCPAPNTLKADGRLMQINQNQALFSILGTTFGGDGMRTFALPKLETRGKVSASGLHAPRLTRR